MKLPNPLIPGFNPDPSVVRVGGDYYLVTSTFEYLPGIPVYHSTDLVEWALIGHVLTRPEQFDASDVPTGMGVWAPTIRHHDGVFHVIVGAAGIGTRVYSTADPSGPWSDGVEIVGLDGIDPDIVWDGDDCYVTFSGLVLSGPELGRHLGIQQVRVDPATLQMLEEPRPLWSGTGGMFPEAPHVYRIGDRWYLLIAEGGTERGHAVTIARGSSPDGPFEGCPHNPVLTARGTARPVQNTGHGDLVEAPDGSWSMVMLGMRTRGGTRGFSPLGRETFGTHVDWVDGWPVVEPVELSDPEPAPDFDERFTSDALGPEWVGVRRRPHSVAATGGGRLVLRGEGRTMDELSPTFVGRRIRRHDARVSAVVADSTTGVGGLSVRYDEDTHLDVEVDGACALARVRLPRLCHETDVDIAPGRVELVMEMRPAPRGWSADLTSSDRMTSDVITLAVIDASGRRHEIATVDGRPLTAESACSFTGRVGGVYCVHGTLEFERYREVGLSS